MDSLLLLCVIIKVRKGPIIRDPGNSLTIQSAGLYAINTCTSQVRKMCHFYKHPKWRLEWKMVALWCSPYWVWGALMTWAVGHYPCSTGQDMLPPSFHILISKIRERDQVETVLFFSFLLPFILPFFLSLSLSHFLSHFLLKYWTVFSNEENNFTGNAFAWFLFLAF